MIRWSYLAPRAAVVAGLLLLVHFGLSPLIHWGLVRGLRSTTGAQLDLERLSASPWSGELAMDRLALSNPLNPGRNLATAQQAVLQVETDELLKGRLIVRQGAIHGLRVGGIREDGDLTLEETPEEEPSAGGAGMNVDMEALLGRLSGLTDAAEEKLAEEFASIRLTTELAERWPQRYEQLSAEIERLGPRLKTLRDSIRDKRGDPLKYLEMVQESVSEVTNIRTELDRLRRELAGLKEEALLDKNRIAEARRQDEQRLRELWKLEGIDADSLSQYLLGEQQKQRIDSLVEWIQWARSYVPRKVETPEAVRSRGVDVVFRNQRKVPRLLVRTLQVDGFGSVDHTEFDFRGTLAGITSEPDVYGHPLVMQIESSEPAAVRVQAILDRTGTEQIDQIMFDCPRLSQTARTIGRPQQMALALSPGSMHLWAKLEMRGDELTGQVIVKQEPVEIRAALGKNWGGDRLATAMNDSLSRVRHIHTVVDVSGSLRRPHWQVQSNLGGHVASALRGAFQSESQHQQDRLAARLQKEIDLRTGQLTAMIETRQKDLLEKLNLGDQEIFAICQLDTSGADSTASATGAAVQNAVQPGLDKLKGLLRQ